MKSKKDIISLAEEKLDDAEYLIKDKRYNTAFYIAGYVIEYLLKAKICKTLGIENLFDFENTNSKKYHVDNNLNRSFKVHDYDQLLVLSGLYPEFDIQMTDVKFKAHWSKVCTWSENCRYLTGKNESETKDMLTSIKEIKQWIEKHL